MKKKKRKNNKIWQGLWRLATKTIFFLSKANYITSPNPNYRDYSLKNFIFHHLHKITTKEPQKELQQLLSIGVSSTIGL